MLSSQRSKSISIGLFAGLSQRNQFSTAVELTHTNVVAGEYKHGTYER